MYAAAARNVPLRPRSVCMLSAIDICARVCYNKSMLAYEAKSVALSAAANCSREVPAPAKNAASAALAYLCGKADKATLLKKCGKSPVYARMILLAERPLADYGMESFCALHKTLFEPKAKCGEIRNGELTLAGGSCTSPNLLRGSLKNVLGKLGQLQGAPTVGKADFAANLCCYVRELIILSPFAYGNDVARRTFIQNFCFSRGYLLNYAAVSKKELDAAANAAFASDDPQPLFTLLTKCLNYRQEEPSKRSRSRALLADKTALSEKSAGNERLSSARSAATPAAPREEIAAAERRRHEPLPPPARTSEQKAEQKNEPKQPPAPPVPKPSAEKAETLRELKEIQRSLAALAARVNDLIKKISDF